MRFVLASLLLLTFACDSLTDNGPPPEVRAPDTSCVGCYVVNTALAISGEAVFVGGYIGDTNQGVLRRYQSGSWSTVAELSSLDAISQLSASDVALYVVSHGDVRRFELATSDVEKLD